MYAFFDEGGYPTSVVQAGHHRAQLIDRPSARTTNVTEGTFNLVRSALQRSDQPGTFKCARTRSKTCPFIRNVGKISRPKRFIKLKITDHFITCTSANAIYCITCTLCIGETRRRLGDRFREHRDAEEHAKYASKPVARHLSLTNISTV